MPDSNNCEDVTESEAMKVLSSVGHFFRPQQTVLFKGSEMNNFKINEQMIVRSSHIVIENLTIRFSKDESLADHCSLPMHRDWEDESLPPETMDFDGQ